MSAGDSGADHARELSPLRKTTRATSVEGLVDEQLRHFSLDPASPLGRELAAVAGHVYRANQAMHGLWDETVRRLAGLDRSDRIAFFNAKRFLCFQLAKLLDPLQNP
ncbi:MAG: Cys/Met metabolism pyridoxal-phosphate-dependent enzyme, partial [Deltaproteobacteria bacterium]|nr:Cys/Met metabolism pyridoxal-phosphate-dependent enzyme [Deltaproteobacteria bacterium]